MNIYKQIKIVGYLHAILALLILIVVIAFYINLLMDPSRYSSPQPPLPEYIQILVLTLPLFTLHSIVSYRLIKSKTISRLFLGIFTITMIILFTPLFFNAIIEHGLADGFFTDTALVDYATDAVPLFIHLYTFYVIFLSADKAYFRSANDPALKNL